MVSLTQRCFSTRNFNWRIRDRFVKVVQPERDLPLHPSLPLHLAFHCLNAMECRARSLPRHPVGGRRRRRVRFVFTPELLPHLMMTHCTRLQMHSGRRRLSRTSVRHSPTPLSQTRSRSALPPCRHLRRAKSGWTPNASPLHAAPLRHRLGNSFHRGRVDKVNPFEYRVHTCSGSSY